MIIRVKDILDIGNVKFKDKCELENLKIGKKDDTSNHCLYWVKNISYYDNFTNGVLIISDNDYNKLKKNKKLNPKIIHLVCEGTTARLTYILILNLVNKKNNNINYSDYHRNNSSNVVIMDNVYISNNVILGEGTVLYPNVVIHSNVTIGKNCIIRENSCLGTNGMGFEKTENDEWIRFPQIGGLIIEDNVEIGSHSDIKRAALENTIIKKGCKLGSYTNIGHNCIIGENSLFTSHCVVAGSNTIGENFYCGINASLKNGMSVGSNVILGANSFLNRNADSNNTYVGTPAKIIKK